MLSSLPDLQTGCYRAVEPPGVPVAVELLDERWLWKAVRCG